MRNHRAPSLIATSLAAALLAGGSASAQPAGQEQPVDPWSGASPAPADPSETPSDVAPADDQPATAPEGAPAPDDSVPRPGPLVEPDAEPPPPRKPEEQLALPVLFDAATAHLLPAGVILSSAGVDTGGGISSDLRVGLGDVAEFGIGSTDLVRVRRGCLAADESCEVEGVRWYPLALFKMGVAEDRLFRHQPALALGFRKSFERAHDARKSRIAELYMVASKSLGDSARLHVGGVFWDASIQHGDVEVLYHDKGMEQQLRPFGGIELEPLPKSKLMLELVWVPEFRIGADGAPDDIELRPVFAWGVRYDLSDWAMIESGVRIPDIGDINLLDAQIFGQLKFVSRRFSRFLDGLE